MAKLPASRIGGLRTYLESRLGEDWDMKVGFVAFLIVLLAWAIFVA